MSSKQILESIINEFALEKLESFFRQKNDRLEFPKDSLPVPEQASDFSDGRLLAEGDLGDGKLIVCSFLVNKELTERSAKKAQYAVGKKILKEKSADAGIFIFYDRGGNFRFSLIYTNYLGKRRDWSNFRRFTYFVSKDLTNKTFLGQIGDGDLTTIEKIKEAFSVEKVTKEFYSEIANWFFWAMDKVKFPDDYKYSADQDKDKEIRNATNLIRLITRIIFIWFLKEKKLVPPDIFSEQRLKCVVKDFHRSKSSCNFYNAILQNLFFATLNQKIKDRKFADNKGFPANKKEYGVKTLYRYEEKFLIDKTQVIDLFKDIPFLNGGLFDCLDKEDKAGKVIYVDGFSRNPARQAIIPDYLFFQEQQQSVDLSEYGLGPNKPVKGLIKILNSYNFTIDENTAIDQEVALDPELLGKVFENLLASYNPETATTARKATGSYYTPREIVDFMVDESLYAYLKGKCPELPDDNLRLLLSYSEESPELSEKNKQELISAIDEIKIIDPACGSGAFPMGVLHKLVYALQKLDPQNNYWYELQYQKAIKESEEVFKRGDKREREERLKEINESFDESINYPDYARKLYLIENCIYGVDIQPIAIQISKLRFFISLVLDQKVDKEKENFGIRPLPNLETRFVAANTLLYLEKAQYDISNEQIKSLEDEIKSIRHKYFQAKTRIEKLNYQKEDRRLRSLLAKELESLGFSIESSKKIADFDLYDQNSFADFFDPEWMFGISNGFDIVIANPPYVSTKGISERDKEQLKRCYGFVDDLYNHFYFKGMELLKESGILAFISSKTFWTIQTKKNLRELILRNKLLCLYDTVNPFDAVMVNTCIILVQKAMNLSEDYVFRYGRFLKKSLQFDVPEGRIAYYKNAPNQVFFPITEYNLKIYKNYGEKINSLIKKWGRIISSSEKIERYKKNIEEYQLSLKPGDITLLGLITEGGQGLATANNGKYIGVLEGTKLAENVRKQRPEKLLLAKEFCHMQKINTKTDAIKFLNGMNEFETRELFDNLKENYGRDIFGQGWLYRIVNKEEIANVEILSEDEKLNGIEGTRTYVPYDKGDKEGNRWYAPTPYYIDWSRPNVKYLKENSGKKGKGMPVVRNVRFYFREGFCWKDIGMETLKVRIKGKTIHDVKSMALFPSRGNEFLLKYIISVLNSNLISHYQYNFINNTVSIQMNDVRQLPIIIPDSNHLVYLGKIFDEAYSIQKAKFSGQIDSKKIGTKLSKIQKELDDYVERMYL